MNQEAPRPVIPRTTSGTAKNGKGGKNNRRPLKVLLATASVGAMLGGWAGFAAVAPPVTAAPPPTVQGYGAPAQDPLAGLQPLPPLASVPGSNAPAAVPTPIPAPANVPTPTTAPAAPVVPAAPARKARPAPITTTRSS